MTLTSLQPGGSAERLAVEWLRTVVTGRRVATRLPTDPVFPFTVVQEVTGGPWQQGAEWQRTVIQVDCYGARGDGTPDYRAAEDEFIRVMAAAQRLGTWRGTEGVLGRVNVLGKRRIEEPVTGWARWSGDLEMWHRPEEA